MTTEQAQGTLAVERKATTMWQYVRYAVGVLLLFAAGMKIVNMLEILAGDGLLANRPTLLTVIGLESAVALFLLIGDAFWAWVLASVTFLVFSGVSVYAIATGKDCNCISNAISSKVMLPFDLAVLALICWVRPVTTMRWNKRLMLDVAGSLVLGLVVAGAAYSYDPPKNHDPLQFLLADSLIDQRWPVNSTLHPQLAPLEKGDWLVLVVRQDCEHCRELLAKHFADPQTHRPDERTACFVAGQSVWPFQLDEVSIDANPPTSISWPAGEPFVASPAIFLIKNGVVVKASDGKDSDSFIERLMSEPVSEK